MAKHDPRAKDEVEKEIHEHKHKGKYKSDRQAIAVGLDKARRKGERVPKKDDKK